MNDNKSSSSEVSPSTIPQSYEDIYKISLRNRQKNKDKKKFKSDPEGQVLSSKQINTSEIQAVDEKSYNSKMDFDEHRL
jgi:hypothetical protein